MLLKKEDLIKPQGSNLNITDGIYTGVIVGYVITHKIQEASEKRKASEYDAIRFAVQIHDDDDKLHCVQTGDMKLSLNERSNLFAQLSSWMKAATPDIVWTTLENKGFMDEDGNLNLDLFVGKPVGLLNKMTPSKKDPAKMYPSFTFIPAKAKDVFEPDPSREDGNPTPLWLKDWDVVLETQQLEGFEWKTYFADPEDDEKNLGSKPSSRPTPDWANGKAEEPDEEAPAEATEETVAKPKLKVRTKAATSNEVPF